MASQDSADRKRRLTSAEQGREYPYNAPGSNRATAIDLTSPPRGGTVTRGSFSGGLGSQRPGGINYRRMSTPRQGSDIELPPWQADAEVTKCPVCEQDFSFLFRKHHCRKCGRVVCSQCSPHRITIPREYIVQPPGSQQQGMQQHIGGAEIVRVCKPCVPDPWRPQESQPREEEQTRARAERETAWRRANDGLFSLPPTRRQSENRYHRIAVPQPQAGSIANTSSPLHPDANTNTYNMPSSLPSNRGPPPSGYSSSARNTSQMPAPWTRPRGLTAPWQQRPTPPTSQTEPNIPTSEPPQRRRRAVKEEDECPVCGIELPPGDTIRESHISECVTSRFSTPPPPSTMAPAMPTSTHDPNLPSSSTPPAARARGMSYRSRGIFPYVATEKDCVDGEGREQECTICMEEFQPGDEMGRLECLCKFHKGCIREWWERKGRGSCPVHVCNE